MSVFLFVGGESQKDHRLIKDVWDAGHLVLFGLLSFVYFIHPARSKHSPVYKFVFTSVFCLLVGSGIEFIQLFTHREFSTSDIINDIIGGYLGLLCLIILHRQQTAQIRTVSLVVFVVLLAGGLRHLQMDIYDEYQIRQQFPLLAGFETENELDRLEFNNVQLERSVKFVKEGKHSLQVQYQTGRYPNITLKYLKGDWSQYQNMTFSVYNPDTQAYPFELKIYDKKHTQNGRRYTDRYNRPLTIEPGWNTITTPLSDIISAPKARTMDIHNIKAISFFTDKLQQPVTIYLDQIHLN
jgi:VanZ family protein